MGVVKYIILIVCMLTSEKCGQTADIYLDQAQHQRKIPIYVMVRHMVISFLAIAHSVILE